MVFYCLSLLFLATFTAAQISGPPGGGGGGPAAFIIPGATWEEMLEYANLQPDLTDMLPPKAECTDATRLQRKAWHTLTNAEKTEYLDAELCLMTSPSKTKIQGAVSRFDDLVKSHQLQSFLVHEDALFLPYHRLQMHAHERLLREECGYTGAQPYWDEEHEVGSFTNSTIFDPVYGFGGSGSGPSKCITTGRFVNYTLHTGPGYNNTEHCITREINDFASFFASPILVGLCMLMQTYAEAWPCFETGPHVAGHGGVGGEMANSISSPGDPLFYMHHTFLDRVWWRWQQLDLKNRLTDIAGYTTAIEPTGGFVNATLDSELNMYGILPNATIRETMDIRIGIMCFEYV